MKKKDDLNTGRKAFDKIQHQFMMKALNKSEIEIKKQNQPTLNLIKGIHQKAL